MGRRQMHLDGKIAFLPPLEPQPSQTTYRGVLRQEIGYRERLGNGLFCVQWDIQEGQPPLTGQRAANFRRDLGATYKTLIDGYVESPFSTACLL